MREEILQSQDFGHGTYIKVRVGTTITPPGLVYVSTTEKDRETEGEKLWTHAVAHFSPQEARILALNLLEAALAAEDTEVTV